MDELIREKFFKLRVNSTSTFPNEKPATKFFFIPYHRNSKNFVNMFKDQVVISGFQIQNQSNYYKILSEIVIVFLYILNMII